VAIDQVPNEPQVGSDGISWKHTHNTT